MAVDKTSLFMVAFISIFLVTAGLLVTGTVPVIFRTSTDINETKYETENQTKIMMDFIKMYLKNMNTETKTAVTGLIAADVIAKTAMEKQDKIMSEIEIVMAKIDNVTQMNHELLERHTVNTSAAEVKAEEAVNKTEGGANKTDG